MSSKRTVLFIAQSAYLLSGFRESDTHIRGRVENGNWNMVIDKREGCGLWHVHSSTSLQGCKESNLLNFAYERDVKRVKVSEHVQGDYNVIINWARTQLEKSQ